MGRLVYSTQVSLDGFITDRSGSFEFTDPYDEVHAFVNDSLRPIGTHLYGRRLYDEAGDRAIVARVAEVAAERGVPRAQVALAWMLTKSVVTAPIVGVTRDAHLDDAVAAVDLQLSAEEVARLEEPYTPHAVVGFS